jgi:hypothetical protein
LIYKELDIPEDQIYNNFKKENLKELLQKIKENSKNGLYSILTVDDYQEELKE